ncbi:MAG: TIGR03960 family B12-binding radical SAM protein [Acidimicrobiaceae bacterium]|nr:TIGR03960 family B12-binding radical SAM protein [Acidimicrobiaceae bacterium]MDE0497905.1 TIGR03960 family B12-binding radical SAM protein [Acidimicrobiaceae bacterium]
MTTLWPRLEPLLPRVSKPARYIGCEDGMQRPTVGPHLTSWLLAYPDTYEIGLPNQGLQILYELLNERPDASAERTYAPWIDLEAEMRAAGLPLFSVDTHRAAGDFDIIAFNLSAELVYTNVLNCIDLAGLDVRAARRNDDDPLIGAGGHCAYNPEPLADFVDFFVIGDGEEVVAEITEAVGAWKRTGKRPGTRATILRDLAGIEGVYVPAMYDIAYDGPALAAVTPKYPDVPALVAKRTVADLAEWPYPRRQLVPVTEVVHDRLSVEVFRGCTRGCRFCQAGMITRPVRERPAAQVREMVTSGLERSGYDEVSLMSLSTADYSGIAELVRDTVTAGGNTTGGADANRISVSLPSMRVDAFTVDVASQVSRARRTGLTFAPEAGSWRLRQIINKLITEEDLYGAVRSAYSQGWHRMKLYFLTGLPSEMDPDTEAIAHLADACTRIGQEYTKRASVTVSLGGFVPKPHTPFQWFGQNPPEELARKVRLVRSALGRSRRVQLKWHDPAASTAEGIASRGDRRVGAVIEYVWRKGGTFQEWSERFDLSLWEEAMAACGLSLDWYVYRHRGEHEVLPWDHIGAGLHRDFLWHDWQDALAGHGLPDCRWTPCYDCGACTEYGIEHMVASPVAPNGGSQGTGQDLATGHLVPVELRPRQLAGAGAPSGGGA